MCASQRINVIKTETSKENSAAVLDGEMIDEKRVIREEQKRIS